MEDRRAEKIHRLTLENRQAGMLTGVIDVHAFDEENISLLTESGKLLIKGEKLHVKSLNLENGEVELEGQVHSLSYLSKKVKKKEKSFMKQFFR